MWWPYKPADNTVGNGNKWSRWELWSDKDEGAKSGTGKPRYSPMSLLTISFHSRSMCLLLLSSPTRRPASKIPRKKLSSHITELSGTRQEKNRTMRDVCKRMLKIQGYKLASHTVNCQLLSCQTFKVYRYCES